MQLSHNVKKFIFTNSYIQKTLDEWSEVLQKSTPKARATLNALIGFDNLFPGNSYPAQQTIARIVGRKCRKTVNVNLAHFKEKKIIKYKQRGFNQSCFYRLPDIVRVPQFREKMAHFLPSLNWAPDQLIETNVTLSNITLSSLSLYEIKKVVGTTVHRDTTVYMVGGTTVHRHTTTGGTPLSPHHQKTTTRNFSKFAKNKQLRSDSLKRRQGMNKAELYAAIKAIPGLNQAARVRLTAFSLEAIKYAESKIGMLGSMRNPFQKFLDLCMEFSKANNKPIDWKFAYDLAEKHGIAKDAPFIMTLTILPSVSNYGRKENAINSAPCWHCDKKFTMSECAANAQKAIREEPQRQKPFPNPPSESRYDIKVKALGLVKMLYTAIDAKDKKAIGLLGQELLNDCGPYLAEEDLLDIRTALIESLGVVVVPDLSAWRQTAPIQPPTKKLRFWEEGSTFRESMDKEAAAKKDHSEPTMIGNILKNSNIFGGDSRALR